MSSNRFGLVEIVEVIRTSNQVETVNHPKNDVDVDTIVKELTSIHNSATKHKDFSRIMVLNNSGNALLPNNHTNSSFND